MIQSTAMAVGFGRQGLLVEYNFVNIAIVILTLTAGSAFLMWIGERITEKGVGNGISIVLVINIISSIPSDIVRLYEQFVKDKPIASASLAAAIILMIILALVVFYRDPAGRRQKDCGPVFTEDRRKKICRRTVIKPSAEGQYGGRHPDYLFFISDADAGSHCIFYGKRNGDGIGSQILRGLNQSNWCDPDQLQYSWGLVVYIILTVFFAYFYTSITFNPMEIANNLKKNGGFVPGIRPGKPTVEYLTKILNYIIFVGACGLILVQLVPILFNGWLGAQVSFGGTSLIIIVSVVLETMKQIESQMLVRNYKGFLNT